MKEEETSQDDDNEMEDYISQLVNMATIQNHLGDIKSFLSIGKKKIIGEYNITIHEHTYVVNKLKGMFFSGTLIDHGQNEGLPVNDVRVL